MDRAPYEILSKIFNTFCDIDYVTHLDESSRLVYVQAAYRFNRPQHLKECMIPISQVCNLWRQVVHREPSLWLTCLYFGSDSEDVIPRVQRLMDSSGGSDVDVLFISTCGKTNDNIEKWLMDQLLALQARIRLLQLEYKCFDKRHRILPMETGSINKRNAFFYHFLESCVPGSWHRLQVLNQVYNDYERTNLVPIDTSANYMAVTREPESWVFDQSRFVNVRCLGLRGVAPSFLSQKLEPSLLTLTSLELQFTYGRSRISESELGAQPKHLCLPNLKKFYIESYGDSQLLETFRCIAMLVTRRLEELKFVCVGYGTRAQINTIINYDFLSLTSSIRRLKLDIPLTIYPFFLPKFSMDSIHDLWISNYKSCYMFDHDLEATPNETEFPPRSIRLPALKILGLNLTLAIPTGTISNYCQQFTWLYNLFDFSTTSRYAEFTYEPPQSMERIRFPALSSLAVKTLNTIKQIDELSIEALRVPFLEIVDLKDKDITYHFPTCSEVLRNIKRFHFTHVDEARGKLYLPISLITNLSPGLSELVLSDFPILILADYQFPISVIEPIHNPHPALHLTSCSQLPMDSVRNLLKSLIRYLESYRKIQGKPDTNLKGQKSFYDEDNGTPLITLYFDRSLPSSCTNELNSLVSLGVKFEVKTYVDELWHLRF